MTEELHTNIDTTNADHGSEDCSLATVLGFGRRIFFVLVFLIVFNGFLELLNPLT